MLAEPVRHAVFPGFAVHADQDHPLCTGQNGQVLNGAAAGGALTFTIVDQSGAPIAKPDGADYRFNSCDVGTSNCAIVAAPGGGTMMADANASLLTTRDLLGTGDGDGGTAEEDALAAISSESLTSPPVLLSVAPVPTDEIVTDPVVTGTGSEEIWRKRRQKK